MLVSIIKRGLPWWMKVGAKLILSRIPAGYSLWQRLGFFRHGRMDKAHYALDVFLAHVEQAGLTGRLAGKTVLELGPGDSVATALIASAYGARSLLVDAGPYAKLDLEVYRQLSKVLREKGLEHPSLDGLSSLNELLEICRASYLTSGLQSLQNINDSSVDLVFSHAVLEHVRKHEFLDTQRELARVLKPDGLCSHRVDLRDHLGGGLNNLRFSERLWESSFFAKSGFYTNRLNFGRMIELFQEVGFAVQVTNVRRWKNVPIARAHLADQFRDVPDDLLSISGFSVVLRKKVLTSLSGE